jgi:hypothetical protein
MQMSSAVNRNHTHIYMRLDLVTREVRGHMRRGAPGLKILNIDIVADMNRDSTFQIGAHCQQA